MPDHILPRLQATLIDRYRVVRELGKGGMATVYLADDLRHHRQVALKVLRAELGSEVGVERFQREIVIAARLQHPNILTVHDSGEASGLLWFTMPFVEGESLRDRLTREAQLPLEDALRITAEVADALDYAHRHGVIHRDIKPENILLTGEHALVADFGIGQVLGAGGGPRITGTGFAIGTPSYMSPEQAGAERDLDPRTDVYSLGAVLYEMLAGEPPFTGPTTQAILAKRFSGQVPPIRRSRPLVPEGVDRAVIKALALAPADRFRAAGDLIAALDKAMSPAPVLPNAPNPPRARWIWIGLALLLAAIAVAWLFSRRHPATAASAHTVPKSLAILPFANIGGLCHRLFQRRDVGGADRGGGAAARTPGRVAHLVVLGQGTERRGSRHRRQYVTQYLFVQVFTCVGDKERALAALERGLAEHSFALGFVKFDPADSALRSDPRFAEVFRKMHLPL